MAGVGLSRVRGGTREADTQAPAQFGVAVVKRKNERNILAIREAQDERNPGAAHDSLPQFGHSILTVGLHYAPVPGLMPRDASHR